MSGYREEGRSYRSLLPLAALLVALFLVDVALGGAADHLVGWLIAAALVLGAWALIIHAARVSHSLLVTDEEVRVGDEAIERVSIVRATPGVDGELPVLGWPTGRARGGPGVVVGRDDGVDVFVPCRDPDRLVAALAVASADPEAIRVATAGDRLALPEIDERAETVFRVAGYDLPRIEFDPAGLDHAKSIFVVGTPPVGYVQVDEVDGHAHVAEIAVLPSSMRRGTGGRLLEHACHWAQQAGYRAVTLITYADVPWNAPFYARHGFGEATADTPELSRRKTRQTELGLDEVGRRIVMRRELPPAPPASPSA